MVEHVRLLTSMEHQHNTYVRNFITRDYFWPTPNFRFEKIIDP